MGSLQDETLGNQKRQKEIQKKKKKKTDYMFNTVVESHGLSFPEANALRPKFDTGKKKKKKKILQKIAES